MIHVKNLYRHADGGYYCILSDAAPMKHPGSGEWIDGVIYTGADGVLRSTSRTRWDERFYPVAEIAEKDLNETELMMIRRANPGDSDFDFVKVMESWHESEMGITGHMLELAVAATVEKFAWRGENSKELIWDESEGGKSRLNAVRFTISTEDLQRVVQGYDIQRVPVPHGFEFYVAPERK